jgi:hypothetical protein
MLPPAPLAPEKKKEGGGRGKTNILVIVLKGECNIYIIYT